MISLEVKKKIACKVLNLHDPELCRGAVDGWWCRICLKY